MGTVDEIIRRANRLRDAQPGSLEEMRLLFEDDDELYGLECPQCERVTMARIGDYLCVTCREVESVGPNE